MKSGIIALPCLCLLAMPAWAQAPAARPAAAPKAVPRAAPENQAPQKAAAPKATAPKAASKSAPDNKAPQKAAAPKATAPKATPKSAPDNKAPQNKAPQNKAPQSKALEHLARFVSWFHPSTLWYLQYRYGRTLANAGHEASSYNRFFVGRGYVTLKFKPTQWFESRVTMDTHQDDEGDWKVRLKYLYAKFKWPIETAFITEPYLEFGLAHMPWLDYEEHLNYYRAQGTMFSERNHLHNSADLGLTVGWLFGRKLPKKYRKEVNSKYPGEWGSAAFGVYNGAGYHAKELNNWKNVEGRISVRPAGPWLPNLQVSYFFVWGKGATRPDPVTPGDPELDWPTWQQNLFLLSFEHKYVVAAAQYVFGRGSQGGDSDGWLKANGVPRRYRGASGFLEIKLPWIRSSLVGRYDYWDGPYGGGTEPYHRFIAGYAFHFWGLHQNFLMLDYEYLKFDDGAIANARQDQWALTLTVQVHLHEPHRTVEEYQKRQRGERGTTELNGHR